MDNAGLTAAEAAARLGVKRQTLYAYVSRGLLQRTVALDGRTSLFNPADIEALRQGSRANTEGELHTLISTRITNVTDEQITIRGHDLVQLISAGATVTEVIEVLWEGASDETWPKITSSSDSALVSGRRSTLDDLRVITALRSSLDPLRHDLSPRSVRSAGRGLITAMVADLPERQEASRGVSKDDLSVQLWRRLTSRKGTPAEWAALDAALALLVDHGLAGSTFAARIAASVRADPYSVVTAGLGVIGGTLHGAASSAVHEVFADAAQRSDAASALGDARKRLGTHPGFGHSVYTAQDPRYGALMTRIIAAWSADPRLQHVYRVRDVIGARSDAIPNVDLAIGALTWLADMPPDAGEVIFAIARTAGWLAHAMEEYDEQPLRFRPKARYLGARTPPS